MALAAVVLVIIIAGAMLFILRGRSSNTAPISTPAVVEEPSRNTFPPAGAPAASVNSAFGAAQPGSAAIAESSRGPSPPASVPTDAVDEVSAPIPAQSSPPPAPPPSKPVQTLPLSVASVVQQAVARGRFECSRIHGGSGPIFKEHANNGLLIGFQIGLQRFVTHDSIKSLRAIYLTPDGEQFGERHGLVFDHSVRIQARPGYAVGQVVVRGGGELYGVTITFMRINGQSLDPSDSYVTDRIGGPDGSDVTLGGDGIPVIGICGKLNPVNGALGLGLVFLDPASDSISH